MIQALKNLFVPNRSPELDFRASQFRLVWRKFRRHRLAKIGMVGLFVMYILATFAEFFVPVDPRQRHREYVYAPPSRIHVVDAEGRWHWPYIHGRTRTLNRETFRYEFPENVGVRYPIHVLVKRTPYHLLGLVPLNRTLFGTAEGAPPLFLMGADRMGRDLFSRIIYGGRISLYIGFAGVGLSFFLGCLLGGISGYLRGRTDEVIQRFIDLLLCLPTLPLWMALSAAVPRDWGVTQTYFAITLILAVVGWAGLARVVRGKFLALGQEEFVLAARAAGCSDARIIFRHLFPSMASYLIVSVTIAIPGMILGETGMSFLGLGMQSPAISWGVLLQDAQDLVNLAHHPWLLWPCFFVIAIVLMFNFVGDGLRDAADPYARV
jgi:peptide/nickel transport system permease protein